MRALLCAPVFVRLPVAVVGTNPFQKPETRHHRNEKTIENLEQIDRKSKVCHFRTYIAREIRECRAKIMEAQKKQDVKFDVGRRCLNVGTRTPLDVWTLRSSGVQRLDANDQHTRAFQKRGPLRGTSSTSPGRKMATGVELVSCQKSSLNATHRSLEIGDRCGTVRTMSLQGDVVSGGHKITFAS